MIQLTASTHFRSALLLPLLLLGVCSSMQMTRVRASGNTPSFGIREPLLHLNTRWTELESSYASDGTMVFVSSRTDLSCTHAGANLFILPAGEKEPKCWDIMNSNGDELSPNFSVDGNTLVFASNRFVDYDSFFMARKNSDGSWSTPFEIAAELRIPGSTMHCPMFLRSKPKRLCFASDRPGGFGDDDIWCADRSDDGTFSKAINAGPNVNGEGKEQHFEEDDFGWIYFTSNTKRPGSLGHPFEIWVTRPDDNDAYRPPVNVGTNVNSGTGAICNAIQPNGDMTFFSFNPLSGSMDFFVSKRLA